MIGRKIIMANKNNFINGITELLVLFFLKQRDYYVYDITKMITDLSEGMLVISQNTIYTATYKLESEGKISEYSKLVGRKRMRVYYHIEPSGLQYLDEILLNYQNTTIGITKIFTNISERQIPENE